MQTDAPTVERHYTDFPSGIPVALWGRDHLTTLLYAETRAVDHKGVLNDQQMRSDVTYPTRLSDHSTVHMHTDYDCLRDAQQVGFIEPPAADSDGWECGEPVRFTPAGYAYVHALRRERAERAHAIDPPSPDNLCSTITTVELATPEGLRVFVAVTEEPTS